MSETIVLFLIFSVQTNRANRICWLT